MINLLPPQYKEGLKKEEQFKVILILGILILFFLICFSLILYSISIFLSGEVKSQEIIYEQREKELKNPQLQAFQENLTDFNQKVSQLDSFYQKQVMFEGKLEKISGVVPAGISIYSLNSENKEGLLKCSLSGFSASRESLIKFKDNLEKEEDFKEVYFPPTCWVKPTDITFTVNFNIIENK